MQTFALVVILFMALGARWVAGTWLHPSAAVAAVWGLFLAIPAAKGFTAVPLTAAVITLVALGALVATPIRVRPGEVTPHRITSSRRLHQFVLFGGVAGGLAGAAVLSANGVSPADSLSLSALNVSAREATAMRYAGTLTVPAVAVLLLALTYGAAIAAPYAAVNLRGWRRVVMLAAPTVGGALYAVATTARAGFLIAVMLTAGAWVLTLAVTQGGRARLPVRSLLGMLVAAGAVVFMFLYAAVTRIGGWQHGTVDTLVDKAAVYSGGGIPAFEVWVQGGGASGASWGVETLAGVSQFFASGQRVGSAYADRTEIGQGLSTNVYTILRPLTEDFTLAGAVLVLALGSLVAAHAFRRAVVAHSVPASLVAAGWLGLMFFSSTTSILTFANVVFGLVVGGWVVCRTVRFEPRTPPLAEAVSGRLKVQAGSVDSAPASLTTSM